VFDCFKFDAFDDIVLMMLEMSRQSPDEELLFMPESDVISHSSRRHSEREGVFVVFT